MNEMFMSLVPGVMGLYMLLFAFCSNTKNFKSALLFQFIPFILGLSGLLVTLKDMGWL